MPVTVRYANQTAAVFASTEDALAQAAHDRCYPGHLNPTYVVDGDQSETHAAWTESSSGVLHPDTEVEVLHTAEDLRDIACHCLLCDFHAKTKGIVASTSEREAIWQEMFGTHPQADQAYTLKPLAGGGVPGAGFAITSTAVALSASVAKTTIGVLAGSSVPPDFIEFAASGDATSGNLLVEIAHGTGAGTGTSTAFTAIQTRGPTQTPTAITTVTYTAEPTVLTITRRWRFPWPGGPFVLQFPLGREPNAVITASAVGKFLGIRATSTVAVTNTDYYLEIEE
jgi:hypothetical protein